MRLLEFILTHHPANDGEGACAFAIGRPRVTRNPNHSMSKVSLTTEVKMKNRNANSTADVRQRPSLTGGGLRALLVAFACLALASLPGQRVGGALPAGARAPLFVDGKITLTSLDGKLSYKDFTGSLSSGSVRINANCANGRDDDADTKIDYADPNKRDPECSAPNDNKESVPGLQQYQPIQLTGTLSATGANNFTVPQANIRMPTLYVSSDKDKPDEGVAVEMRATGAGTGSYDISSGAMTLTVPLEFVMTSDKLELGSKCKFASTFHLSTENGDGQRFKDGSSPELKLTDGKVSIDATPDNDCGSIGRNALLATGLAAEEAGLLKTSLWITFNGDVWLPTDPLEVTETESNNTATEAQSVPLTSTYLGTVHGSIGAAGDVDYYKISWPPSRTAVITHVVTKTTRNSLDCETAKMTIKTTYSEPLLLYKDSSNHVVNYTQTSVTTKSPLCKVVDGEMNEEAQWTQTVVTYKLYDAHTPYSSANPQTTVFSVAAQTGSGFPTTGTYELKLQLY